MLLRQSSIQIVMVFFFIKNYYSHFYVGSMFDDIRLHVARSHTSSADSPSLSDIIPHSIKPSPLRPSFLPPSLYFHFHLPPSYVVLLSSHHITCPYHFNFLSCTFFEISPTFVVSIVVNIVNLSLLYKNVQLLH